MQELPVELGSLLADGNVEMLAGEITGHLWVVAGETVRFGNDDREVEVGEGVDYEALEVIDEADADFRCLNLDRVWLETAPGEPLVEISAGVRLADALQEYPECSVVYRYQVSDVQYQTDTRRRDRVFRYLYRLT